MAAYTGAALAANGKKTLLIELGGQARSLELILGVRESAFGMLDVFAGRCTPKEATIRVEGLPGLLFFLPAGDGANLWDTTAISLGGDVPGGTPEKLGQLIVSCREAFDFVVVDGADISGLPIPLVDTFLMVVTPDTLSVRAGADFARRLYRAGAREVRLVINNVPAKIIPIEGAQDFDDVIDIIGARLISVIPQSPKLAFCSNNAQPLDTQSLTVQIFENLAGRLMGKRIPLLIR